MKRNLFYIATLCAVVSTNVSADTKDMNESVTATDVVMVSEDEEEVIFNNKLYVPASNNKFFISIELPLLSYVGSTVSLDGVDTLENTEIKLKSSQSNKIPS